MSSKQLLELEAILTRVKSEYNIGLILYGLELCTKYIRQLNKDIRNTSSTGRKQNLMHTLHQVRTNKAHLKILSKQGGGAKKTTKRVHWEDSQNAFQNRIRTAVISNLSHLDPTTFLEDCKLLFNRRVSNILKIYNSIKINVIFCADFTVTQAGRLITERKHITTNNVSLHASTPIKNWFNDHMSNKVLKKLSEFQERQSGWMLSRIVNLSININKNSLLKGSSYIPLPEFIQRKHACINVRNFDNACFAWAITSALRPAKNHSDRLTSYPHYSKILKLKGIQFPFTFKQIPNFENQNKLSINVYSLEKDGKKFKTVPSYLSHNVKIKHINLLIIQDNYSKNVIPKMHYVWVKNLPALINSQVSSHKGKIYLCDRCLHYFHSKEKLDNHALFCKNINHCRIRLPTSEDSILKFKNFRFKETVPFIIYADFECILEPITNINVFQKHIPCSVGYYVKCYYDNELSFYKSYRGRDCQTWFINELHNFAIDVETVFLCPIPMHTLTKQEHDEFYTIKNCHICEEIFDKNDIRVHDHCHITGRYRGPAHNKCNIQYKDEEVIPVVFHNLSGYDSHFIIESLAQNIEGKINLLPITKEKYISFTKYINGNDIKFRFIDSYRFMAAGLDKLASYLSEYPILKSEFLNVYNFNLLTRKGIYPYDYMDNFNKFTQSYLPAKIDFYNKLNDEDISESDYAHANKIWTTFNCQNLGDYSDLYMKTDILLLADVFEQFRNNCIQTYKLDPAHYYTLPGYTWDCMLKFTKMELQLLTDIDMIMFIERGIRGGLSQCVKRYAEANNKYQLNYDESKPSKYLAYFDINNQYGYSMSEYLPYGGFEWVDNNVNWDVPNNNLVGYILEVDLEYPHSVHDSHSDLPFCPEHRCPPNSKEKKLLATLYKKEKYVIHYRNLKQALDNGLKLLQIHRILKFNQSDWLKAYIDLNTAKRTAAANEFEKNVYKLMNNSCFGKTIENVRKHSIVKLISKWDGRFGAEALIAKPNFKSCVIFNESLAAIELNKTEIYLNKPIYVGMCILDISKTLIYDFHYKYMNSRFGKKAHICYTDTDSLIYEVETENLYDIIREDALQYFDTSDYESNNIYAIPLVNKKVIGLMKDENNGKIMSHFAGLRSKMYAYKVNGIDKDKKSKGIKQSVVRNKICFDDYVKCLMNNEDVVLEQNLIKSNNHKITSICQQKVALSPFDDKRHVNSNNINTLPWGHYSIM